LSVEAVHAREMLAGVFNRKLRFVGADGGVVSVNAAFVVTKRADDAAERFPAASVARTVNPYVVEGASPLTVALVPVDIATCVVPRNT